MKNRKNILISPLEWGLGHAARIVPIAKRLRELDNNVVIASGQSLMPFFRTELPDLRLIGFPGFRPFYSAILPQYLVLLLQTPFLIYHIVKEHYALKKIIADYNIDIVISDNRFGLWNKSVKTAYISHMPLIPFPRPFRFLEFIGKAFHLAVIKKYSLCFIPDLPGENNLSGRLSHGFTLPQNVRFIGILSRLTESFTASKNEIRAEHPIIVILSGPEPQRSILKNIMTLSLNQQPVPVAMLGGDPAGKNGPSTAGNITYFNHLPAKELSKLISSAETVICRSGYSTIMELASLKRSALIIPTPGQPEQEYLAEYLSGKGYFKSVMQNKIRDIKVLGELSAVFPENLLSESAILLTKALEELSE